MLDNLNFSLRADSVVAFQIHFEDLLICCLPPRDFRKKKGFFTEEVITVTFSSSIFLSMLPLRPFFLLKCLSIFQYCIQTFSTIPSLFPILLPWSFLPGPSPHLRLWLLALFCVFSQMSTFMQLLLPPHPSVCGLSWLHSYSASHLFSSCNPDSLFQLIRSPTVSFALVSTFLSLIF